MDRLFAPPTEAEMDAVRKEWRAARVRSDDVRIPSHPPGHRLPVLVVAHGGDRGASGYHFFHDGPLAEEWIQVVPSFRSEPLFVTPFRIYRSEGISNPWAGDVEDAMALLGAVLEAIPEADSGRVAVLGHSRGGGVALLMGIRDPRVKAVVSVAAPTDFFLPEVRSIAERAFRWPLPRLPGANYLADSVLFALRDGRTSVELARLELLRRSAAWFVDQLPPTQAHRGQRDDKVAHAHAEQLSRRRSGGAEHLELYSYPEGKHRTRTLQGAIQRVERCLEAVARSAGPLAARGGE